MHSLRFHLTYNSIDHIVEVDEYDNSIICVYRRENGHYIILDDIEEALEEKLDKLTELLS